jgi:hypothetical protein
VQKFYFSSYNVYFRSFEVMFVDTNTNIIIGRKTFTLYLAR